MSVLCFIGYICLRLSTASVLGLRVIWTCRIAFYLSPYRAFIWPATQVSWTAKWSHSKLVNEKHSSFYEGGQPTRGGPPAWRFGEGLEIPRRKNQLVTNVTRGFGLDPVNTVIDLGVP